MPYLTPRMVAFLANLISTLAVPGACILGAHRQWLVDTPVTHALSTSNPAIPCDAVSRGHCAAHSRHKLPRLCAWCTTWLEGDPCRQAHDTQARWWVLPGNQQED